jgi:hypothetical protein
MDAAVLAILADRAARSGLQTILAISVREEVPIEGRESARPS